MPPRAPISILMLQTVMRPSILISSKTLPSTFHRYTHSLRTYIMKQFLTLNDLQNFDAQVALAKEIKANPYQYEELGKRKTLGALPNARCCTKPCLIVYGLKKLK